MNRREFLEQVTAWTAGITLATPVFRIMQLSASAQTNAAAPELAPAPASPTAPALPKLAVAKGRDYAALVTKVFEPLGGMSAFVKPGQKVVVKPNIAWDRSPEQAANTNPEVVKAIVLAVLSAGAAKVLVFDHTCNDARRTYNSSGILPAIKTIQDPRVSCVFVDKSKFVPVKIDNGKSLKEWDFYEDALKADCYINVPIAKVHGQTKLTLGLKNIMGIIGGKRGSIHQDIAQKLVDLNTVVRPKVTIIDATRILLRHGPVGGNISDVRVCDTVIASADPVAADAYATTLFDMEPSAVPPTVAAYAAGLGEMDLKKIQVIEV